MPKISVIQILKSETLDYRQILQANSEFLKLVNQTISVEYIVYDNLKNFEVLKFVKELENVKYFRKDFKSTKSGMLETGLLASGEKLLYLRSADILTTKNVEALEATRPNIFKKDLKKISKIKKEDFSYDNFNLLVKENKTFLDRIKTLFI